MVELKKDILFPECCTVEVCSKSVNDDNNNNNNNKDEDHEDQQHHDSDDVAVTTAAISNDASLVTVHDDDDAGGQQQQQQQQHGAIDDVKEERREQAQHNDDNEKNNKNEEDNNNNNSKHSTQDADRDMNADNITSAVFPPCTAATCSVDEEEKERAVKAVMQGCANAANDSKSTTTTTTTKQQQQQCNNIKKKTKPTCEMAEKCVSACAAYGKVCPCAARIASLAACKAIQEIKADSVLFAPPASTSSTIEDENGEDNINNEDDNDGFVHLDADDLVIGEKLGSGGFSNVNECIIKTGDEAGITFAVKYLKRNVMVDLHQFKHGASDLATEAHFLKILNHRNIVNLHGITAGSVETNVASGKECGFFIVIDRLEETLEHRIEMWRREEHGSNNGHGGSSSNNHGRWPLLHLNNSEHKEKKRDELMQRLRYALMIADALEYIHSLNVVFRDLKPDNIGFDSDGNIKLFDFGLAKELKSNLRAAKKKKKTTTASTSTATTPSKKSKGGDEDSSSSCNKDDDDNDRYYLTGNTGSRRYMCPEVALDKPYGKPVDVYSFGILLWELCTAEKPFYGYSSGKHMSLVVHGNERPKMDGSNTSYWPINIRTLVTKCWSRNPSQRPTFSMVKNAIQHTLDGKDGIEESLVCRPTTTTPQPLGKNTRAKSDGGTVATSPLPPAALRFLRRPLGQPRSKSTGWTTSSSSSSSSSPTNKNNYFHSNDNRHDNNNNNNGEEPEEGHTNNMSSSGDMSPPSSLKKLNNLLPSIKPPEKEKGKRSRSWGLTFRR